VIPFFCLIGVYTHFETETFDAVKIVKCLVIIEEFEHDCSKIASRQPARQYKSLPTSSTEMSRFAATRLKSSNIKLFFRRCSKPAANFRAWSALYTLPSVL